MGTAFRVVLVGASRCGWANEAVADWKKRLAHYGGADEVAVKAEVFRGDVEAVRKAEGARIQGALGPRDRLLALDERGQSFDTPAFARLLDQQRQQGTVVLCLGGAYGFDEALRQRAQKVVRLSELTLNHEVARVVIWEQLYRALSLLHGSPYHHE